MKGDKENESLLAQTVTSICGSLNSATEGKDFLGPCQILCISFINVVIKYLLHSVHFSHLVMSDVLRPHGHMPDPPSITNSWSWLKLMSINSVMPSNHPILCHTLLLLPSIFSSIRVFSNDSVLCIRWPEYWNFSFNISPSSDYSGLISFRMGWFDLLAVQGTLKHLLQHYSPKHQLFAAQLSFQSNSHIHTWLLEKP